MNYYFYSSDRLNISGSDCTAIREEIKEIYKFNEIDIPLGYGLSDFLNIDIDKWWMSFHSLLLDIINEYDVANIDEYIHIAISLCSETAYFSIYNKLFYNEILLLRDYKEQVIRSCKEIKDFFETREYNIPISENGEIVHKTFINKGEIDRLKSIQSFFLEMTNLCLSSNKDNALKQLYRYQEKTFNENKYKLTSTAINGFNGSVDSFSSNRLEINKIDNDTYEAVEVFSTNDIYDICYREFIMLVTNDRKIKQCENSNCQKYFVPENRYDTKYCDKCKDEGIAMKKYQKKIQQDPLLNAYNKAYQSKYAKMVKPYRDRPLLKKQKLSDLRSWTYEAKNKISEFESINNKDKTNEMNKLIEWLNNKEEE